MVLPVTAVDFAEIRWQGHWIWVPEQPIVPGDPILQVVDPAAKEAHGLFRRCFQLERVPARVPARITADSRYVIFANGEEVFRGPIRCQPRRLHYDLFDLAPYLRSGENILAVYVKYYGTPKSFWIPAVPNMTLGKTGVLVFEADLGEADRLVSDAAWKARKAEAWPDAWRSGAETAVSGGIPIEVFDARLFPPDWQAVGFDDSAWGAAQIIPAMHIGGFAHSQPPTDPYGPLYPRPIAKQEGDRRRPTGVLVEMLDGQVPAPSADPVKQVEASLALPLTGPARAGQPPLSVDVPSGGTARLVFDMGAIVCGFVEFELDAAPGTVLDLSYVEEPLKGPSDVLGQHAGSRYIARGRDDRFEVFDANGLRYIYVLVHGVPGTVTLRQIGVREHLYPWQEGAAFACDDEDLNRLYKAGIRTVRLNSHDAFIDCPTREQRAWVGDSVVHQMVHLATNLDWRLAGTT